MAKGAQTHQCDGLGRSDIGQANGVARDRRVRFSRIWKRRKTFKIVGGIYDITMGVVTFLS